MKGYKDHVTFMGFSRNVEFYVSFGQWNAGIQILNCPFHQIASAHVLFDAGIAILVSAFRLYKSHRNALL